MSDEAKPSTTWSMAPCDVCGNHECGLYRVTAGNTTGTGSYELEVARVMVAAPDLLAALEDMAAGWAYIRTHHGDLYGVGWDRAEGKALAAIAKARGTE